MKYVKSHTFSHDPYEKLVWGRNRRTPPKLISTLIFRSQLKQAVVKMVQECCTYVDKTPDKETKIKLIETLRSITEGKIYVEVERARLTHILAKMREEEGDTAEAAKIIQELQVETYGSMDKREKVELILEQMRLCLNIKDYVRTQIISKKINTKFFEEENTLVSLGYGILLY